MLISLCDIIQVIVTLFLYAFAQDTVQA